MPRYTSPTSPATVAAAHGRIGVLALLLRHGSSAVGLPPAAWEAQYYKPKVDKNSNTDRESGAKAAKEDASRTRNGVRRLLRAHAGGPQAVRDWLGAAVGVEARNAWDESVRCELVRQWREALAAASEALRLLRGFHRVRNAATPPSDRSHNLEEWPRSDRVLLHSGFSIERAAAVPGETACRWAIQIGGQHGRPCADPAESRHCPADESRLWAGR